MDLLIEQVDTQSVETSILTEANKEKKYIIRGPFMEANQENRNKRIYPHEVLAPELETYQQVIKENRAVGELNHPNSMEIGIENIAMKIDKLAWSDKNTVFGEAKILSTPKGMIVRNLMDEGIKFGVSSRGAGTLKEGVVQNDYKFVAVDLVWEPSARSAMVENIMEAKTEWVLENGILTEKQLEIVNQDLSKKADPEAIQEAFLKIMNFTTKKFMNELN